MDVYSYKSRKGIKPPLNIMFARKNHLMYLLAGNFFSGTHSGYAVMISINMLTAQPTMLGFLSS